MHTPPIPSDNLPENTKEAISKMAGFYASQYSCDPLTATYLVLLERYRKDTETSAIKVSRFRYDSLVRGVLAQADLLVAADPKGFTVAQLQACLPPALLVEHKAHTNKAGLGRLLRAHGWGRYQSYAKGVQGEAPHRPLLWRK